MKHKTQRRVGLGMAGLVLLAGMGCNVVADIYNGRTREPALPCSSIADCKVEVPQCRYVLACEQGRCVFEDVIEGTGLVQQTPGDCLQVQCDGAGQTKQVPSSTDSDDGNPCTLDSCDGSTPVHALLSQFPCYEGPPGTKGKGACKGGMQSCDPQGQPIGGCAGQVVPAAEVCITPEDDDCDGESNEEGPDCACTPGEGKACYTGPAGTEGKGTCHAGTRTCQGGLDYSPCEGEQTPAIETCDMAQVDEDCDGDANEEGPDCHCGDGYVSPGNGEACDDGNLDPFDACTEICQLLSCGNGYVQSGESCDDGNTHSGDGCPASCLHGITFIAMSGHGCAILEDGRTKCWGSNYSGELGLGDTQHRGDGPSEMGDYLPAVDLGTGVTAVQLDTGDHSCALLNDGRVKCWGYNYAGQLGLGDTLDRGDELNEMGDTLPVVDLGQGNTAVAIALGGAHSCVLLNDGRVKCWGDNSLGRLGLGDTNPRGDGPSEMGDNLPAVDLGEGKTAVEITAGDAHSCARLSDHSVKCWGRNSFGQLGLGDKNHRGNEPNEMGDNLPAVDLGAGKQAVAITAGSSHTCALLADGSVKCWGSPLLGPLGLGDANARGDGPNEMGDNLPVIDLGTGKTASGITAGWGHTCALLNDGSIKCWGSNMFGELGLGDTNARGYNLNEMGDNLPAVDLGMGKTVIRIVSYGTTCATFSDHSAKCWGDNSTGRLGLGHTISRGGGPNEMGDKLLFLPL